MKVRLSPRLLRPLCLAGLPALVALSCDRSGGEPDVPVLGAIETLESPAGAGSGEPNLFVDAAGRVYLSWIEQRPDRSAAVQFSVLENERWSAPRTIVHRSDLFVNWADFPSLLVLRDGQMMAHWLQRSGEGTYSYDVRMARSTDGGATWSESFVPHRDGTQSEHGFVSMFSAGGDTVGAVWLDGRRFAHEGHDSGNEMMLAHTVVAPDGSLGAEQFLDERICDCCQTSMAHTSQGPVVVYRDRSPEEIRDISIVRLVGGGWTDPQRVHADEWHIASCPVNGPSVVASGSNVAVAWFTAAQDTARVLVAFSSDAGASFGAPVRVDGGAPSGRVAVIMDGTGGAIVSWVERGEGEVAEIRIRRVAPEGKMSDPATVAGSSAARSSGFPRMAVAGDRVIFAWTVPGSPRRIDMAQTRLGDAG